jgi:hypothetical protein
VVIPRRWEQRTQTQAQTHRHRHTDTRTDALARTHTREGRQEGGFRVQGPGLELETMTQARHHGTGLSYAFTNTVTPSSAIQHQKPEAAITAHLMTLAQGEGEKRALQKSPAKELYDDPKEPC